MTARKMAKTKAKANTTVKTAEAKGIVKGGSESARVFNYGGQGAVLSPLMEKLIGPLSRGRLARETGIHYSHLSRVFSGDRTPSLDKAGRIVAAINRIDPRTPPLTIDNLLEAVRETQSGRL